MVILKVTNPKTKELVVLPSFKLPPTHKDLAIQPTAVEARHFAATYALFRVCSMRNIHMMLPPNYRDLWKSEFQDLKKSDMQDGKAWMYEADPFTAKEEREQVQALMAKKREEREKQNTEASDKGIKIGLGHSQNGASSAAAGRQITRGWTKVPKIEMGKRIRADIESIVRQHAVWNPYGIKISEFQGRNIVRELVDLGFRQSHVEEGVAYCKDREEVLEWLLVHVPEDDLPKWSLPEGYTAGLTMASGNIKREASIRRLSKTGYVTELCEKLLDQFRGDERAAAESLQKRLTTNGQENATVGHGSLDITALAVTESEDNSTWIEEQDTLNAIFGDRYTKSSSLSSKIQLQITRSASSYMLSVRKSALYPKTAPIISITSTDLPAYIRLSMIRQAVQYANNDLLGEPMIFNLVDWLEREIPRIIDKPGLLRDVSAGISFNLEIPAISIPKQRMALSRHPRAIDWRPGNSQSLTILHQWQARQADSRQQKMLAVRQSLPAWSLRDTIIHAVNQNQVTIISGETGSGKSTQAVQFILDDMIQRKLGAAANIMCTQPRRISALGLADRVSDERCSAVGGEVGYAIRGESKQRFGTTKITFVTTGVLLRRLQTSGGNTKDVTATLADVSHVVVDEVHERSLDTDFLLILLKEILTQRKDLKVVLMSATLDAGVFERYFSNQVSVGKVEIQGRTFPVDDYYLDDVVRLAGVNQSSFDTEEDQSDTDNGQGMSIAGMIHNIGMRINYDFIASTVRAIDNQLNSPSGGILIFLPGVLEINRCLDALRMIPNLHALPLHASLLSIEQRRVFPPAPHGKRKVIAATNVAETSITIEDIVAVIDTGKVKETSFDPQNNIVRLEEVWASRAACKQRRGRAGRVQAGKCYKLYTRNAEAKMAERPEPEIRRVPLEQLCLSVRAMGVTNVRAFLASALTPPESMAVEGAIKLLGRMSAIDGDELTALGQHLAMIPADLRCGKLMVYGAMFGCFEACLTIAAILTVKSPFVSPQNKRDESKAARTSFAPNQGDLLCDLKAYEQWSENKTNSHQREVRAWCDQNFLSNQTLNDISSNRSQYLSSLKEAGFITPNYSAQGATNSSLNGNNGHDPLIRALVASAFNPQLARIEFPDKKYVASVSGAVELNPEARAIKLFNQENGRVFVHPSSTLFDAQSFIGGSVYMSYFNKMATSKVFIRELTPFNAYTALLFSGPISLDTLGRGLVVDGWLRLRGWARIGVLVSRLRMMLDGVLAEKIENPTLDLGDNKVVHLVRRLIEFDGLDR